MNPISKVRIDKWLWSVRIFKSRSIAAQAIRDNKVKVNGKIAKTASLIAVGDELSVKKDHFNLLFKVYELIEKRVGAPIAITCYQNITPEEELNKFKSWYIGAIEHRPRGTGRPTKKERREIDDYKDQYFDEPFDFED